MSGSNPVGGTQYGKADPPMCTSVQIDIDGVIVNDLVDCNDPDCPTSKAT